MEKNVGTLDSIVRAAVALILIYLYFAGYISGAMGVILLVAAVTLLATALTGWCGLYKLLGISTRKK